MRRLSWALLTLSSVVFLGMISRAQDAEVIVREIEVRFIGPETVNRAVVMANIQTAVLNSSNTLTLTPASLSPVK